MPQDITIDEALGNLSGDLTETLALLHPESDEVAELTLGMLPLGSRSTLIALGAISQAPLSQPDAPVIVTLTDFGRELIAAAALEGLSPEAVARVEAFEEARARREEREEVEQPAPIGAHASR
jgi:hypothetical protein